MSTGLEKDNVIFWLTLSVLILCTLPLLIWPVASQQVLSHWKLGIENNFGSIYQLMAIGVPIFVGWLAFSRYGHIKLGENTYAFSTFSWASTLFCAGVATGILYWGTIEWAYYMDLPMLGLSPGSKESIEFSATYGMFHWGIIGWSFYSLPAVAIAYAYYVRKTPTLRISLACRPILGKHADGFVGRGMDILFMVGLLGSSGTSLGLGTPMVTAGLASLFDIQDTFSLKVIVILFCTLIFSVSVYSGLGKGIKRLSIWNTIAAFIFLSFVLLVGPTLFIIKMGINSFGLMADNMIRMVTWTDPLANSRFVEDWSIFYWAWWIAVGPFMGIFIAKISGGRSIRQVILGTVLFGSLGCCLFFIVLGNFGLYQDISGQLPILELVQQGEANQAIVAIINSLGFGKLPLLFFCLMSVVFIATSFDSISYTLASCATINLETDLDPARWHRLFWAATLILLPIGLMYVGGLESLKFAVLLSALPLVFILFLMGLSLVKSLKSHESSY